MHSLSYYFVLFSHAHRSVRKEGMSKEEKALVMTRSI